MGWNRSGGTSAPKELCLPDGDAGVKDRSLPIGRDAGGARLFAVGHHHRDFPAKVLFVETKSLLAVTAIVETGV
jgi:hypothetical protein